MPEELQREHRDLNNCDKPMQVTEWLRLRCYGKQMSTARPSPVNK